MDVVWLISGVGVGAFAMWMILGGTSGSPGSTAPFNWPNFGATDTPTSGVGAVQGPPSPNTSDVSSPDQNFSPGP